MTGLTRITISLPDDIEEAINDIKMEPEFQKVPKSKIVCGLVRKGLDAKNEENEEGDSIPREEGGEASDD